MALQLTLDGTPKLVRFDEESALALADVALGRYREYTAAIQHEPSNRLVFWRVVFSILSVNTRIEANISAYRAMRSLGARQLQRLDWRAIASVLDKIRPPIMYYKSKARYLSRFARSWAYDSTPYGRNGSTHKEWADRLEDRVKGLGIAKARFAVALADPVASDVCCVDSWLYRLFTGKNIGKAINRRTYVRIEAKIRRLSVQLGVSCFAAQWMLWDSTRGWPEPHAVLREV